MGLEIHVLAGIVSGNIWLRQSGGEDKMDNSTKRFDCVVTAPEGTDLSREPNLNPKTTDGRENIILKVPFGTPVAAESEAYSIDGRCWVMVKPEIGNEEVIGWMAFDFDLWTRDKFEVIAPEGTDLRREPVLNPKTKDGRDNVVLSLPVHTRLILLHSYMDVVTNDGHEWRLVIPLTGSSEMGWVANDVLERRLPNTGGGPSEGDTYTFNYAGIPRNITETNLETALKKNKLSVQPLTDLQMAIELDKPYQNIKKYYTSLINLQNITTFPPIL